MEFEGTLLGLKDHPEPAKYKLVGIIAPTLLMYTQIV